MWISVKGRMVRANREALSRALGRPLHRGMCACHRCDNPSCVRATHLFEGTHAENMADMRAKGRSRRSDGESNVRAKLTAEDVAKIRERLSSGASRREIGVEFGVSTSTIYDIYNGRSWASEAA